MSSRFLQAQKPFAERVSPERFRRRRGRPTLGLLRQDRFEFCFSFGCWGFPPYSADERDNGFRTRSDFSKHRKTQEAAAVSLHESEALLPNG